MKRLLAVFLGLLLLIVGTGAVFGEDGFATSGAASEDSLFETGISHLRRYMNTQSVQDAVDLFSEIDGDYQNGGIFKQYSQTILALLNGDMEGAQAQLNTLPDLLEFDTQLAQYGLPSRNELSTYMDARKLEEDGKHFDALEKYLKCLGALDALDRVFVLNIKMQRQYESATSLVQQEAYQSAADIFASLGGYMDSAALSASLLKKIQTSQYVSNMLVSDRWNEDLYCNGVDQNTVLGSAILRSQVRRITFVDNLVNCPQDCWDVSAKNDRSVLAWTSPNGDLLDLYIGANGPILGNIDCHSLFYMYSNLESIHFNGCFDTTSVIDMGYMFAQCSSLKSLDVRSFRTNNVSNMEAMFAFDVALTELNLEGFNMDQVTNAQEMFTGCFSLQVLYGSIPYENNINLENLLTSYKEPDTFLNDSVSEEIADTSKPYQEIQSGNESYSSEVALFQKALIEANYLYDKADGLYGDKTAAAVEALQTDAGLPVTGQGDVETQKALHSLAAEFNPQGDAEFIIYYAQYDEKAGHLMFYFKNIGNQAITGFEIKQQECNEAKSHIGDSRGGNGVIYSWTLPLALESGAEGGESMPLYNGYTGTYSTGETFVTEISAETVYLHIQLLNFTTENGDTHSVGDKGLYVPIKAV